jgi:F like protein
LVKAKSKRRTVDAGVDAADWTAIDDTIAADLRRQYEDAARVEVDNSGTDISFDVFSEAARDYAEERGGELVTDLSDSTREMLRSSIAEAIKNGQTNTQFAKDLMDSYAFSEERALSIARTELAYADVAGHKETSSKAGAVGKRWLLSNDHDFEDECNDNAEEDVIAFDDLYQSGDDFPPSHPNCQCDFEAIYADDPDAEDLIDDDDNRDEFEDGTEKVLKYNEDQPRDDHGRFGSGSEGTYGNNTSEYDKMTSEFKPSEGLHQAIEKYADDPANEQTNTVIEKGIREEGVPVTTTLYRGLSMDSDKDVRKAFGKAGTAIRPQWPQSTSTNKAVGEEFAGLTGNVPVLLTITRTGALKGLPVKSSGQSEFVLSKDTYLKVRHAEKIGNTWHVNVIAHTELLT